MKTAILSTLCYFAALAPAWASLGSHDVDSNAPTRAVHDGQVYLLKSGRQVYATLNHQGDSPAGKWLWIPGGAAVVTLGEPFLDPKLGSEMVNISYNSSRLLAGKLTDINIATTDLINADADVISEKDYYALIEKGEDPGPSDYGFPTAGIEFVYPSKYERCQKNAKGQYVNCMTFCVKATADEMKRIGECDGYVGLDHEHNLAKESMKFFRKGCHLVNIPVNMPYEKMPYGTFCISEGTGRTCTDSLGDTVACGDVRVKTIKDGEDCWWSIGCTKNGLPGIGKILSCAAPTTNSKPLMIEGHPITRQTIAEADASIPDLDPTSFHVVEPGEPHLPAPINVNYIPHHKAAEDGPIAKPMAPKIKPAAGPGMLPNLFD